MHHNQKKLRTQLNGYLTEFQLQFSMDLEMHASIQEILTLNKFLNREQVLKSNALKSVYHHWERSLITLNILPRFLVRKLLRKIYSKVSSML